MMMKAGFIMDENMSNLTTSASGEASASSGTRNENFGNMYPVHSSFASTNQAPAAAPKKKRSLPGNPDPDAEVIALSPKSLMARNRFMCEICNKGFQRDQNLQLHRRGHNLPWKLKQRPKNEVIRKKVYVCPEATCVHHDPSRALGDLTGIKKHFSRKHGEKKWKCEKCSKRYAVQSDWKAHSKICGTREYRCDCGTLFSRRDSFITHRAFCDALAEESARRSSSSSAIPPNYPLLSSEPAAAATSSSTLMINLQHNLNNSFQSVLPPKTEQDHHHHHHLQNFIFRPADNNNINSTSNNFPPWLNCPPTVPLFSNNHDHQNPNHPRPSPVLPPLQSLPASPHMSATALLQKASQMGVTNAGNFMEQVAPATTTTSNSSTQQQQQQQQQLMHDMMSSFEGSACFDEDQAALINNYGMLMDNNPIKREINGSSSNNCFGHQETSASGTKSSHYDHHRSSGGTTQGHQGGSGGGNEGLTRDFLGLRSFSHKDFFNIAGLEQMNNSSSSFEQHQNQNQTPWHG